MSWLVTGANGFVGRALCAALARRDLPLRALVRDPAKAPAGLPALVMPRQDANADWSSALAGIDVVIHLAARVHVMREAAADPLSEFRMVNVAAAAHLARRAAALGVRRLVYVSSIKVNGESTDGRGPYTEDDAPAPADAYGRSKLEGEQILHEVAAETGLELCVLRPALVYGPGVKGNLERLLGALWRGLPLPFGAVRNQRSLLGLDNLCEALTLCASHAAAAGATLLAADSEDLSTAGLCQQLAAGLGRPARLLPIPPLLLRGAGALTGRGAELARLCGSLQIDAARLRALGWKPRPVAAGLAETAAAYRQARQGGT